jgi:cytidyltransferase-like protein
MSGTLCLVGGTFDRLHAGHLGLLKAASTCDAVEVWVTSDANAAAKDPRIESFTIRTAALQEAGYSTHLLEDDWGPAPTRPEATHIVCTPETRENCERINRMRADNDLPPLELLDVDHALARDGLPISSSRIRQGSIDRDGGLWILAADLERVVHMPDDLGAELKDPMGTLYEGPEDTPEVAVRAALEAVPTFSPCLVAVGDVTVQALLEADWVPHVGLIDGMTKREVWDGEIDESAFAGKIGCDNPAGQLTPTLLECLDLALEFTFSGEGGPVLIEVEGEEDLAPILVHLLAPLGTAVLYGQPGKGVVLRITDEAAKAQCRALLDRFEAR